MSDGAIMLPYGQAADGRMIPIAQAERGAACGCVCPQCNRPLIAKKGDEIQHHFAHASDASCEGARETMLHKLGKQIISDVKAIWLPAITARVEQIIRPIRERRLFEADHVEVETAIGPFRPDVVMKKGDRTVAIEILVSHRSTPEKIAFYRAQRIDAVEIDLNGMRVDAMFPDEVVRSVTEMHHRYWLFNQEVDEAETEICQEIAARRAREEMVRQQAIVDAERNERRREMEAAHKRQIAAKLDTAYREQMKNSPWKQDLLKSAVAALGVIQGQEWYRIPTMTCEFSVEEFPDIPTPGEIAAFEYELAFTARHRASERVAA